MSLHGIKLASCVSLDLDQQTHGSHFRAARSTKLQVVKEVQGMSNVHHTSGTQPSNAPEYRFETVLAAAQTLDQFALELQVLTPPNIPRNITSVRGWAIRFEALHEYVNDVPTASLKSLAEQLNKPIKILSSYIRRWDQHVSKIDPLLRTYKIMPGEEDMVDNVRVLLERAIYAQRIVTDQLQARCA